MLWVGTLVNRLGLVVLPFLTLYLTEQRELSVGQATLIVSGFGAGAFGAHLIGGSLADRIGRRATMLLSLVGGAVIVLAIPFLKGLVALAVSVVVLGLFGEMYRPAVSAAVADLLPDAQRPRAFALLYWVINVGAAVAPAVGGFLATRSYTALFVLDGLTMIGYALFIFLGVPETKPEALPDEPGTRPPRVRDAFLDPALVLLTVCAFLISTLFFQAFTTLPLAMRLDGLSASDFGLTAAVNGVLIVIFSLAIARWAEVRPPALVLAGAAVVIGLGFGLHAVTASLVAYMLAVAVWTGGEMMFFPVAPAVVARLAPVRLQGSYQGIYGAAWGLAALVGPALGGWTLEQAGPTVLWLGGAALGLIGAAGFALLHVAYRDRLVRERV